MGVVYLAEHPVIGRKVAIKLLHAALARDTDIVSRFFNEARAIHMIAHPNIVEILDFGQTTDGQPYFIMEYLAGESLARAIARGPMPPDRGRSHRVQMCRALEAAHAKKIVHRDLKPHNVHSARRRPAACRSRSWTSAWPRSCASPDGAHSVKTRTGSLMGTPLYMSPEQCKGSGMLDHRTDIYSLGVMLFEMIAGRPPFTAEGVGELFAKHMLEEPPPLLHFAPETPPYMAAAIMKALAKEQADRFQSMEEFRKALVGEVKLPIPTVQLGARGTEIAPAHKTSGRAATTLSSATSELDDSISAPARTRKLALIGGGAVAAIVLIAVVIPKKHPASPPPPAVASATRPEVAPPPPPAPPASKDVTIRFETDPPGAHVIDQKDGKDLGAVPMEVRLPKGGDPSKYTLKLAGYREVPVTAKPTADRTMHVLLDKVPEAAPPHRPLPASRHTAAAPPIARTSAAACVDEDGLATPSF